ncbi:Terpenoid cyclases/protein prenyltransferase alpha-alpha toroid [Acididesulfobacillus acetoxydans]|uniref:Prenyltransferase/squalene oxidase n=1 Tax=Acididesulfobacillus acetoxydans TaxID=1561005 RepID=A0A8S0XZE8_9FIRM|nr:prenyltransferase [Acididesulfobacillus acetoxydans]CAA7602467.1 Terpenoid cyclases/protein prenyltransferase alpha-alpha toroid [Acididesulfobacillus acetoxydans]CEJ05922.1 Prenyltransferase/squalene oxidase [Acididesulfobacillus acetoxydans]
MVEKREVEKAVAQARQFVFTGMRQILSGKLDEAHGVSASPGATALAVLALLTVGRDFGGAEKRGITWLRQQRQGQGWGKYPGDSPDPEISRLVQAVTQSGQGGWLSRVVLLSRARQFSEMILSLGQKVVPGLEGPTPEEIALPGILREAVLRKLPAYGRPVVVAAALLASNESQGIRPAAEYLVDFQMGDGSWSEDVVATSLALLALVRWRFAGDKVGKAGEWLVRKQYGDGSWPAFDHLQNWSVGWALNIMGGRDREEAELLAQAERRLKSGQYADGSYGSTSPYTQPDLDDTAVALLGLSASPESRKGVELLKRLQNRDGSWGTFPSFRGKPPDLECGFPVYIRSTDVTLHILEALGRHRSRDAYQTMVRGLEWLLTKQKTSGALDSVWFEGPIYGTAQLAELLGKWRFNWQNWTGARKILLARRKAQDFLWAAQNPDGSWGSSVAETALGLSAVGYPGKRGEKEALGKGVERLIGEQQPAGSFRPSYRGIYAKGWNYEEPLATALTVIQAWEKYLRFAF